MRCHVVSSRSRRPSACSRGNKASDRHVNSPVGDVFLTADLGAGARWTNARERDATSPALHSLAKPATTAPELSSSPTRPQRSLVRPYESARDATLSVTAAEGLPACQSRERASNRHVTPLVGDFFFLTANRDADARRRRRRSFVGA